MHSFKDKAQINYIVKLSSLGGGLRQICCCSVKHNDNVGDGSLIYSSLFVHMCVKSIYCYFNIKMLFQMQKSIVYNVITASEITKSVLTYITYLFFQCT